MMNDIISSFNAGELSPYVESRTSLDKYRSGCKVLENYLITPYGPANRRAGTEFLGAAKLSITPCRLFGLNLSDANHIVMELGVGYMRFWQNGALMTYGSSQTWNGVSYAAGAPLEAIGITATSTLTAPVYAATSGTVGTPHPYQAADLNGINITQVNNVVYLTHPNYPPMRVSYWGQNPYNPPFTVGQVPWAWAPMLDQNTSSTTIAPSAETGSITLTASAPVWVSSHVGAYWEIAHSNPASFLSVSFNGTTASNTTQTAATSSPMQVVGDWSLQTFGNWSGTLVLYSSEDGVNYTTLRTYNSYQGDYNATSNGTFRSTTWVYLAFTPDSSGYSCSYAPRCLFQPIDPTLRGFVQITGFTSSTSVTATVISSLAGTTATPLWREGAFSAVQGYPNISCLHESRIVYSGTAGNPSQIWGSVVSDFENFRQGAYDADSYAFTLASSTGGRINWMVSKIALLIGTTEDEWYIAASSQGSPLTASNVLAQKESHYGSANLQAFIVNDTVLYVQRMARKIREFIYTWQSETWVSNDLTALAQHITLGNIVNMAYQRVPDAVLWFVRGDGTLVSMTYEREQQVTGFSRQTTTGSFESVCTIQNPTGEDEIWVSVNRTIGQAGSTQTVRYIERLKTGMRDALDTVNKSAWWYVDAGKTQTFSSPTTTITGLSHLEGQTVAVWADQAVGAVTINPATNAPWVVTGGSITLQSPASQVLVGLPYTSKLVPQMLQKDLQDGTSAGRRMRIAKMNVKVYNSFGGEYSSDGVNWYPLPSRHLSDPMDASPPTTFGYERVSVSANWRDGVDIYIRQTLPVPLTIAAIVGSWESSESGQ